MKTLVTDELYQARMLYERTGKAARVWLSFAESYPYAELFRQVLARIEKIPIRC